MSIRQKILASLIFCSALLVMVPALFNYLSFSRGLNHYLVERSQQHIEQIADQLQLYYQNEHTWDALEHQRFWFMRVLEGTPDHAIDMAPGRIVRHLALLDHNKSLVAGNNTQPASLIALAVNNKTVGWLSYPEVEHVKGRQEQRFLKRQMKQLLKIGLFAIVLAIIFAWLLAHHLVKPIESLSRSARQLARGNYQNRNLIAREDELGQLANDINQLAESLQQGRNSQARWLADMSHELRTPVAILQGEIQALVDGIRQPSKQNLLSLETETEHLRKLLDDLHDLSLADSGSFHYQMEKLDFAELLDEVTNSFSKAATQQGLILENDALPQQQNLPIQGDQTRLRQLLHNLFSNSIKYTDTPGQIIVTAKQCADEIMLTLEDSAPSVDQTQLDHLFDHLYRVESSRNRRLGGSGLGLAISKQIVAAHQGTINATQSQLGGVTITITLPRAKTL